MNIIQMPKPINVQPPVPPCPPHRYEPLSVRIPFNMDMQWVQCENCGALTLETDEQRKKDFVASKGFVWMADKFYIPGEADKGFLTLDQAYQIAQEMK